MVKACILGIGGLQLSHRERAFFAEADPLGFILFARNCDSPDQIRALVEELRAISGRTDAPILIDQEGGRVARLTPPHWRAAPPAAVFGELFSVDPEAGILAVRLNAQLIGAELHALGINVDCAPVLDLPRPGADPIIGDRAFGKDPGTVATLGRAFRDGLSDAGVLAVIKHIPGHGRADADSHLALPRVATPLDELAATDFAPFKALSDTPAPEPWAMTAHVVYERVDADRPGTLSAEVIGAVIRREIGFDGILISDDLSMQALAGPMRERAQAAIAAGCDLNLHCNGRMEEMIEVAAASPPLSVPVADRLDRSLGALAPARLIEPVAARAELDTLLARTARQTG
ncbi:MAG: beta-N-acetylhexosaminidase [Alphaproteobacteria bacterium]|nr:beta-N-acetylhexosaminidase [Alphaproteobacteria bacterium]